MNKYVNIYCRVSTQRQTEGISLETQVSLCTRYAEMHGYKIRGLFEDRGKSGKSVNSRDGLHKAIEGLNKNTYLLVYSMSRFSRSMTDAVQLLEQIKAKGSKLLSFTENFNGLDETDDFHKWLSIALAEKESKTLSVRVSHCMARRKEKLGSACNSCRYGYKYDSNVVTENGKLQPIKIRKEWEVIERIMKERRDEISFTDIASNLNRDQVPTRMKGIRNSKCVWDRKVISSIVKFQDEKVDEWINAPFDM